MRYFSTFSGIGGFELGIKQAYELLRSVAVESADEEPEQTEPQIQLGRLGSTVEEGHSVLSRGGRPGAVCIGYSEIDKYATAIYQKHFPEHKNYGDITKINAEELPDFDLLVGGFPCQAFSIAGKRRGFEDTRGTMFFELARILRAKQPRLFVFENVKGLLSHDNGNTFRTIIATLDELGYDCEWQVLNSKNHGVPQNRERVFIVGHLRGTPRPQVFPFGETAGATDTGLEQRDTEVASTLRSRYGNGTGSHIQQLNTPTHSNDRVYGADGISPTLNTMQGGMRQPFVLDKEIRDFVKSSRPNEGEIGITYKENGDIRPHRLDDKKSGISELAINYEGNVSNTITSSHEPKIYRKDMRIRRLTPTECERLQGFPDGWTENGLSDIMEICVNINPAIEKQLLQLDTVSSITSDGSGMVIPISQNESKEPVSIVLHELLLEDGAISIINHGNAMATLFNRRGTLLNATQLKESLISEKMVEKSTCKLWKVSLVGHYEREKLSTILTWINEIMQSITSISARIDENIIGVIILLNSRESNYSSGESLCLRMGNITPISDTQRYKTLGNAVTVNVIRNIFIKLLTLSH